jgi:hypothetical protein
MRTLRLLILRVTHRMWNTEVNRILCQAKQSGVINNAQLHELCARFDPSQNHMVGKG